MTGFDHNNANTVLVTGATGFVGYHVAVELMRKGYSVRCMVRATSNRANLPAGVEIVEAKLSQYPGLRSVVEGCRAVVHVAGLVKARNMRDFYLVNRDGTANLAKAAGERQVERFVLCSSQAAAGPSTTDAPRRSSDPPSPVTEYGKSKLAGEYSLRDHADGMWWSVVRPPAVYGPRDTSFLTLAKCVKYGVKLKIGKGSRFSMIHVNDLARAVHLALTVDGKSGKTWFATDGETHTGLEVAAAVESALDKRARQITVPFWSTQVIAGANELFARLRNVPPFLTREKLHELTQPNFTCDDSDFREATGFMETFDLNMGMQHTVNWYKGKGWL